MSTPEETPEIPTKNPGCLTGFIGLLIGFSPAIWGPIQVANECGSNASESTCGPYMWPVAFIFTLPIGFFIGLGAILVNHKHKKSLNQPEQSFSEDGSSLPASLIQKDKSDGHSTIYSIICSALAIIANVFSPFIFSVPAVLIAMNAKANNEPQGKIAMTIAWIALGLNLLAFFDISIPFFNLY